MVAVTQQRRVTDAPQKMSLYVNRFVEMDANINRVWQTDYGIRIFEQLIPRNYCKQQDTFV